MDPLPYNLAAMPLYRSPDHWFGGGAAKIAADRNFGMLALLRLYTRPKGRTKKIFACLPEHPRRKCLARRSERAIGFVPWRK